MAIGWRDHNFSGTSVMEHKHRDTPGKFIYSINVKDIPTRLNTRFLENRQEMALLASGMRQLDNFTTEKTVVILLYHERHWFLAIVYHIGNSPAVAILDSIRRPVEFRYQLATQAVF